MKARIKLTKGQIIPFVFLLLLISGIIIGYIFYNVFYGTRFQTYVTTINIIDTIRNVIEYFKSYLGLSLTYSSHQSLREHACWGGTIGEEINHWICNTPNPVEVEQSKQCLEKYTKYYLNEYNSLFTTSLPIEITKYNFTDNVYGVDAAGVFSGKYDEGYFWVNSSGAKLSISDENIKNMEKIETSDFITKNRYWYLFRKFYEWAQDNVYGKCICSIIGCSCSSSSGEEACTSCSDAVKDCAKRALDDLQRRFDNNVTCKMKQEACMQGRGPPCLNPSDCLAWASSVRGLCTHDCIDPSIGARSCPITSKPGILPLAYSNQNYKVLSSSECPTGTFCSGVSECVGLGGTCTGSCSLGCCCSVTTTTTTTRPSCPAGTTCVDRVICGQAGGSCVSSCGSYECCCYIPTTPTTTITTTVTTTTITTITTTLVCYSDYWHEGRVAASYSYTCEDHKYYVPSDKGPVPLSFKVIALASWRDQDVCRGTIPCSCPPDATSCADCTSNGCTPCR
jgi:hypothetical protein